MPQEDKSVAASSVATLPDGTTMSLQDYFNGRKRDATPEEEATDELLREHMRADANRPRHPKA